MQKFPQKYRWQLVIDGFEAVDNNKETFIKNNKRQLYLYTLYRHSQTDCLKTLFVQSYPKFNPHIRLFLAVTVLSSFFLWALCPTNFILFEW